MFRSKINWINFPIEHQGALHLLIQHGQTPQTASIPVLTSQKQRQENNSTEHLLHML